MQIQTIRGKDERGEKVGGGLLYGLLLGRRGGQKGGHQPGLAPLGLASSPSPRDACSFWKITGFPRSEQKSRDCDGKQERGFSSLHLSKGPRGRTHSSGRQIQSRPQSQWLPDLEAEQETQPLTARPSGPPPQTRRAQNSSVSPACIPGNS